MTRAQLLQPCKETYPFDKSKKKQSLLFHHSFLNVRLEPMKIPAIGLGTWQSTPGAVGQAVRVALDAGYRHIDCARIYHNEREVGEALSGWLPSSSSSSPRDRSHIFVTSKLWNTDHRRVREACQTTLRDLQLSYLDLYLIHWPIALRAECWQRDTPFDEAGRLMTDNEATLVDTWRHMERLVDDGLCRSIGVSNFNLTRMKALLPHCRIKPSCLQVEMHPYLPQWELLEFCRANGIDVVAYSPLGSDREPRLLQDPVIVNMAKRLACTPAQLLLKWAIQRGTIVIPKSVTPSRIAENFAAASLPNLTADDMASVRELGVRKPHRYINPGKFWKYPLFDDETAAPAVAKAKQ